MRSITLFLLGLLLPGLAVAEAKLSAAEVVQARQTAIEQTLTFENLPLGSDRSGSVRMKRIDVYAPDAKILLADKSGYRELPRSNWLHFIADSSLPNAPRLGLSMAPDGKSAAGVLLADDGRTLAISGTSFGKELRFQLQGTQQGKNGKPALFACDNDRPGWKSTVLTDHSAIIASTKSVPIPKGATRSAAVAIDTDNELLQLKFADNTANASNYFAQLFVALNVVYERDLDLRLLQGTTILRPSNMPDPYVATGTSAQLTEFGTQWQNNQSGVSRAFAMFISGKSLDAFSASGIAWVLGANANYCQSRNAIGGHYSVSQVFRFQGATAADDLLVIAHELGHNFGAEHAHCSNATTGVGGQSSNTIDQCFNTENGCYSGAPICPAASTVNGVPNVQGTLMSYCHLSGLPNCESKEVFATAHRTLLTPRVVNNVNLGCFTVIGAGAGALGFASATQTVTEGTTAQFSVTRTGGSDGAVAVNFATSNGTAIAPGDYSTRSGTLNWAAGDTAPKNISVPIIDDGQPEGPETFTVTLSSPTNGATLGTSTLTATIAASEVFPANCQFPTGYSTPNGSQAWIVTTDSAQEGSCSLRSAQGLSDNSNARVQITGNFNAGNVSFFARVSSEAGFDCFRFLVNGVRQNIGTSCDAGPGNPGISGEFAWQQITVPVTAGNRTFVWSYEKDGSDIGGSDAAWIDLISLPALAGPADLIFTNGFQ
jgi:Calx-beta domain/Metallo-peptidase family M12